MERFDCEPLPDLVARSALRSFDFHYRRLTSLLPIDQEEIARVDDEPRRLAGDEDRVEPIDRVGEKHDAAAQTAIPERERDHAPAHELALEPLDDEARCEQRLAEKADE